MKKFTIFFLIAFILLFSCKKDSSSSSSSIAEDKKMVEENNFAQITSDDADIISDQAYTVRRITKSSSGSSSGKGILADTVKVTFIAADSTIIIDFGSSGILGNDGKTRKGKIIVQFKNGYRRVGTSKNFSFDNYYVNNTKVEGTRKVTYNGIISGKHTWAIEADLKLTNSSGGIHTWKSSRSRTMIAGESTPLVWIDDEYSISGTASGTTSSGQVYSLTTSTPLIYKVLCSHFQAGILVYTRANSTATIDYSYGLNTPCDNQAKLTYNGRDYFILL